MYGVIFVSFFMCANREKKENGTCDVGIHVSQVMKRTANRKCYLHSASVQKKSRAAYVTQK